MRNKLHHDAFGSTAVRTARPSSELHRKRRRYEKIFCLAEDGIVFHELTGPDSFGTFLEANPAICRMLGYTRSELQRMTPMEIVLPKDRERVPEEIETVQRDRVLRHEKTLVARDGRHIPVEIMTRQFTQEGRPMIMSIIRDVSDRKEAEAALRESQQRLKLFVEHAPVALAMFDRQMRYLSASRRWRRDYKLGSRELRGMSHYEVFPELPERWKEAHRRGLAGEVVGREEDRFERADGSVQWVRWEVRPWYGADGQVGGIILFTEQITDRKEWEEALRTSEGRLKIAKESADLGIYDWNIREGTVYWDERVREIWGLHEDEPLGFEKFVNAIHPQDAGWVLEMVDRVMEPQSGGRYYMEYRVISRLDGLERWVGATGAVYYEAGRAVRMVGTVQDITERKRAETALRESEERLRLAAEAAHFGTYDADLETGMVYWSDEMKAILGFAPEVPVMSLAQLIEFIHPRDAARVREVFMRACDPDGSGQVKDEHRFIRPDGQVRWVQIRGQIYFSEGRRRFAVRSRGTVQDVTDRREAEEKLRKTAAELEKRTREMNAILSSVQDYVYILDAEGRFVFANQRMLEPLGLKAEEIGGRSLRDCGYPEEAERILTAGIKRVLETGQAVKNETCLNCPFSEQEEIYENILVPIHSTDGRIVFVAGSSRDVTERKQTEEALRYNQRLLSGAEALSHTGAWEWDLATKLWTFSEEWQRIHGCSKGTMRSAELLSLASREDRRLVMRAMEKIRRGEEPYDAEYRIVRKEDGQERFVHARGQTIRDAAGRVLKVYGFTQDITERRQTEAQLRQALGLLEGIAQGAQDQIAAEDGEFRYIFFNEAYRRELKRIWGIDLKVGMSMVEMLAPWPDDQRNAKALWERALGGESFHLTMELGPSEDKQVYYLRFNPIHDGAGRQIGAGHIMHNVTDQVRMQRALQEFNEILERRVAERTEEVQQKAEQLRALALELGQAEQRERKRLAKVLHDHIQQFIVAARMQLGWIEHSGDLYEVHSTAQEVNGILEEALTASRSLAVDLSPPVLHEAGLIGGLQWLASDMARKNQFHVRLQTEPHAEPQLEETRVLVFECVRELLFNAVKHAGVSEAEVSLTRADAEHIRLIVSDRGKGFDPDVLKNRGADEATFGLFSIQERLAHIGGQMQIDTSPGEGARIVLTVPSIEAASEAAREGRRHPERTGHLEVRRKSELRSVLIVDDHRIMREGLSKMLRFEPEIEIVGEAANGPEAIELADTLEPDVIIMDVNLGEMSGVEATRQIVERHPEIKVVGLSMHLDESVARAMREAGAATYLTKSGPSEELIAAVKEP